MTLEELIALVVVQGGELAVRVEKDGRLCASVIELDFKITAVEPRYAARAAVSPHEIASLRGPAAREDRVRRELRRILNGVDREVVRPWRLGEALKSFGREAA